MQQFSYLFLLGITLVFSSCGLLDECGSSKADFLKKYEAFVREVEQQDWHHADNDWQAYDERLEAYLNNCYERYEPELTAAETKDFWLLTVSYYVARYDGQFVEEFLAEDNPLSRTVRDHFEELEDDPERFFRDLVREVSGGEVDELFRDLGRELESMGKRLQDWLDER
ncbi:MAG: hypothetical protein AAFW73_10970 [Bacteroidota bacterium]